ncbi:ATP-dependent DNA helicase [Puniceicoccus vermicola]|uniref:ATP-dependent DNA helicase n=2 Tax=Puniceicoccus vermicola TaxID=388746 RepID=A0A7X1E342_9BACT|nr:ATP-dependent DNA helicase [Puniceicoccus vermicola]
MIRILDDSESPARNGFGMVALTEKIFGEGGWLQVKLGLEHRPQQEEMAIRVAQSFAMDAPIIFEAGTGVGKSLAYLVPGIIYAVDSKRPFLVSTHTISLQEQIREKDIEQCRVLFKSVPELHRYAGFESAFLVGRGNYVCMKRLVRAAEERADLFNQGNQQALDSLSEWATHTKTGLRQETDFPIPPDIWDAVNADASTCNRKNCPAENCFFHSARQKVQKAHLIILNHSLLFSLIAAGMSPGGDTPGILYPNDFVVVDEAHTLPIIATNHLGAAVSSYAVERALRILYNPKTKKGFLKKIGNPGDRRLVAEALAACSEFFEQTSHTLLGKKDQVRLAEGEWTEPVFQEPLLELTKRLKALAYKEQDETRADEIRDQQLRIDSYRTVLGRFLALDFDGHVPWVERTGKTRQIISLRSAPIDLAPVLRQILFRRNTSVALTSATLATSGGMDPFLARIGADGQPHGAVTSPFDYERHCEILITTDCPASGGQTSPSTIQYWSDCIVRAATAIEGGSLILFTSYRDLAAVVRICRESLATHGRPLFEQVPGGTRSQLLDQFREAGNGVLFGTETFWTGIDVPGPALSQVIMTKLPFENPSHPVFQAREEYVRDRGGHPFLEISLPEAVLRFRQGLGRLIRKVDDRGRLVILDSRVLRKEYGRAFVEALPKTTFTRFNRADWERCFPRKHRGRG